MARFLVAWEFGEDLGHLRRMMPIGRALRDAGHEVAFAFRDATRLCHASDEGFAAWPAPVLRVPHAASLAPLNASEMLLNLGFRDRGSVSGVQRAWQALLDAARPEVVVADYAPNALLAASRRAIPRATIGSGFARPPRRDPMPALRPGVHASEQVLRAFDEELVDCVRGVLADHADIDVDTFFGGDLDVLATLAETDPFGPREDYVGPVLGDEGGVEAAWNTHDAHVLAYLKPRDARFNAMVEALHAARVEALVAAPGLAPASAHALSGGLVRVVPEPLRLPPLLADAGLCVGHGGPGFAAASLLAGVPLAILPMHLEHDLVALRLHEQGLGVVLDATRGAASLREGIAAALSDAAMHQRARAIAARYEKASAPDAASEAAARLARLAA